MQSIRFWSLCAGIGGFDLGLEMAGMQCVGQVEIDLFCREILDRYWPKVPKYSDIRTFNRSVWDDWKKPDLIVAGYPCQPFSTKGKRLGENDNRNLWPEVRRVLCESGAHFGLFENVPGHISCGLGRVLCDLAESGFDAEWSTLSAWGLGSHDCRERLFIFAYRADAYGVGWQRCRVSRICEAKGAWSDEQFTRLVQHELQHAVPTGSTGRVSDGVSRRVHRLRSLGNAVKPQQAECVGMMVGDFITWRAGRPPSDARK